MQPHRIEVLVPPPFAPVLDLLAADLERYLDAVMVAGALPYAKLLDASKGEVAESAANDGAPSPFGMPVEPK